jgi:hypothetical protein
MPGLDDFKSQLRGGGARPSLFRVGVNFPTETGGNNELASFMIKAATLPASIVGVIEVPFRGRKLKIAGDRTYEPWTITVTNDTGMEIRNAFERWMHLINANSQNISSFGGGNSLGYMADMYVDQLDRDGNITKRYNVIQAWPTNVSSIDLNYETVDTVEEFTVELNFQYWTSLESGAL